MSEPTRPGARPHDPLDERDEAFDVLDAQGEPTGRTATRDEVHASGAWHAAVHVWIVDDENRVLLQRRAPGKDLAGGKIDVSVGGHLRAGETWLDALREVEEELGVTVGPEDLARLGTVASERIYPDATDREHQHVFALRLDWELRRYAPDPREVDVLYLVPLERALRLWRDGAHVPAEGLDAQGRPNHALLHEADLIRQGRAGTLEELRRLAEWAGVDEPPPGGGGGVDG
jgi:isopentenyldiphosphate isomerase